MTVASDVTVDRFAHLDRMTDARGVFEHAEGADPRLEHGYCTDDNARMLAVTSREADEGAAAHLSRVALAFTLAAVAADGRVRNRMAVSGTWTDAAATNDAWGRAVLGLGVAAARHADRDVRAAAMEGFTSAARQRSAWPRAMAFAALGAADVLLVEPAHHGAQAMIRDALNTIGRPSAAPWSWPERRLTYANATLAEAVIAAAVHEPIVLERGLTMLGWLLDLEMAPGHLSVTGAGGSGPTDERPQFDQQPIEVAAMADACWRAHAITDDERWAVGVRAAAAWFDGTNDVGAVMYDAATGGSYDGLLRTGPNLNQGAESTLALISTGQRARALREAVS